MFARLGRHPFLDYAVHFWTLHTESHTASLEGRVGKLLIDFLTDDYKVSSAQTLFHSRRLGSPIGCDIASAPTLMSGMHLACELGYLLQM